MRTVSYRSFAASVVALALFAASAFGGRATCVALPESALDVVGRDQHYLLMQQYTCAEANIFPGTVPGYKCSAADDGETCIQCSANQDLLNGAAYDSHPSPPGYQATTDAVSCTGDLREGLCEEKDDGSYFCSYNSEPISDGCWDNSSTQPEQQ